MQSMHKQFRLTRYYSKKSEVLILTPLTPSLHADHCDVFSSLCNPISISKDGCCECSLPDLACQKTTGTEQLNCIYIHTKINKYTKKTLSFDAL